MMKAHKSLVNNLKVAKAIETASPFSTSLALINASIVGNVAFQTLMATIIPNSNEQKCGTEGNIYLLYLHCILPHLHIRHLSLRLVTL